MDEENAELRNRLDDAIRGTLAADPSEPGILAAWALVTAGPDPFGFQTPHYHRYVTPWKETP